MIKKTDLTGNLNVECHFPFILSCVQLASIYLLSLFVTSKYVKVIQELILNMFTSANKPTYKLS